LTPVLQQLLDKRPETRPEAEQGRALLQAVADAGGTDTPTTTLRGDAAPRPKTQPDVPSLPPGFVIPGTGQGTTPTAQGSAPTEQRGPVAPGSPAGRYDQAAPGSHPAPYAAA